MDGSTAAPLGSVYHGGRPRPFWLRWLLPPSQTLQVHEAEDDSLLFTIQSGRPVFGQRPWNSPPPRRSGRKVRWAVCDADGRSLGELVTGVEEHTTHHSPLTTHPLLIERGKGEPGHARTVQAVDLQGRTMDVHSDWLEQPVETPLLAQFLFSSVAAFRCASVRREQDEILLKFDEQVEGEPFFKMLILGAVLIASAG